MLESYVKVMNNELQNTFATAVRRVDMRKVSTPASDRLDVTVFVSGVFGVLNKSLYA